MSQFLATRTARDSATLARVREIVEQLTARDRAGDILTAVHHIPAREAKFAPMPEWVRADLAAVYAEKGVGHLYSHQAAAAASRARGAQRSGGDANCIREDSLLQPARSERRP